MTATNGLDMSLEPLFVLEQARRLDLRGVTQVCQMRQLGDCLDYAIARDPGNLKRHAQRILWHGSRRDAVLLYAAFVDLYIVLGPSGQALKQRLLDSSTGVLTRAQRQCLQQHFEVGFAATESAAAVTGSMLAKPVYGHRQFVHKQDVVSNDSSGDVLDEARQLLEEGDVSAAQALLEQALRENARDDQARLADLREELRQIYRATRNDEGLRALSNLRVHA